MGSSSIFPICSEGKSSHKQRISCILYLVTDTLAEIDRPDFSNCLMTTLLPKMTKRVPNKEIINYKAPYQEF